ncbi:MAG: peptidylprolyl isomerase [Parvularculales bacterium]
MTFSFFAPLLFAWRGTVSRCAGLLVVTMLVGGLVGGITPVRAQSAPAGERTIATVGDSVVTDMDIRLAQEELGPVLVNLQPQARLGAVIDYLVSRRIVSMEATGGGLESDPDFDRRMGYYKERVLYDLYLERKVADEIGEDEVRSRYDAEIKNFEPQEEVSVQHILLSSKADAQTALADVRSGESFTIVAEERSIDDAGTNGGRIGWISRESVDPAFAEAAFALDIGEISEPVETGFGWHIIKMDGERLSSPPAYDAVKAQVKQVIAREKGTQRLEELRDKYEVTLPGLAGVGQGGG